MHLIALAVAHLNLPVPPEIGPLLVQKLRQPLAFAVADWPTAWPQLAEMVEFWVGRLPLIRLVCVAGCASVAILHPSAGTGTHPGRIGLTMHCGCPGAKGWAVRRQFAGQEPRILEQISLGSNRGDSQCFINERGCRH